MALPCTGQIVAEITGPALARALSRARARTYKPAIDLLESRDAPARLIWIAPPNAQNANWSDSNNWWNPDIGTNQGVRANDTLVFGVAANGRTSVTDSTDNINNIQNFRIQLQIEPAYAGTITLNANLTVTGGSLGGGTISGSVNNPATLTIDPPQPPQGPGVVISSLVSWTQTTVKNVNLRIKANPRSVAVGPANGASVTLDHANLTVDTDANLSLVTGSIFESHQSKITNNGKVTLWAGCNGIYSGFDNQGGTWLPNSVFDNAADSTLEVNVGVGGGGQSCVISAQFDNSGTLVLKGQLTLRGGGYLWGTTEFQGNQGNLTLGVPNWPTVAQNQVIPYGMDNFPSFNVAARGSGKLSLQGAVVTVGGTKYFDDPDVVLDTPVSLPSSVSLATVGGYIDGDPLTLAAHFNTIQNTWIRNTIELTGTASVNGGLTFTQNGAYSGNSNEASKLGANAQIVAGPFTAIAVTNTPLYMGNGAQIQLNGTAQKFTGLYLTGSATIQPDWFAVPAGVSANNGVIIGAAQGGNTPELNVNWSGGANRAIRGPVNIQNPPGPVGQLLSTGGKLQFTAASIGGASPPNEDTDDANDVFTNYMTSFTEGNVEQYNQLANDGLLTIGDDGNVSVLTLDNGFTQTSTATLAMRIGSPSDEIETPGPITLDGALVLQAFSGFAPSPGELITLIANEGDEAVDGTFEGLPEGTGLSVGGYYYTISYLGGTGHDVVLTAASSGPGGTTSTGTTVSVSGGSAGYGAPVTLTADVTGSGGTPTGSITFFAGTTALGTTGLPSSGVVTLVVSSLSVGTEDISASYSGDATFLASTSGSSTVVVDEPPVLTDVAAYPNGSTVTISALADDYSPESYELTITSVGTPADGTATINAGQHHHLYAVQRHDCDDGQV